MLGAIQAQRRVGQRESRRLEMEVQFLQKENELLRKELDILRREDNRPYILNKLEEVPKEFKRKPVAQRGHLRLTINEASLVIDAVEAARGSLYAERSLKLAVKKLRQAFTEAVKNHAAMRGKSFEELRSAKVRKRIEDGTHSAWNEQAERILSLRDG